MLPSLAPETITRGKAMPRIRDFWQTYGSGRSPRLRRTGQISSKDGSNGKPMLPVVAKLWTKLHEHAFLTSLSRALCPGGVLMFLIPQRRLATSARYLAAHFTGFRPYRFPDPEYADFRQMVLLATKKAQATLDPNAQARLELWSSAELPPLSDEPDGSPINVPTLPRADILFAPLAFDPTLAAREARRRGVWTQPAFAEQLWPPDEQPVRPLMPLRRGHLALLIAAGLLNDVVLQQDDRRVLVKGRTRKELVDVETDDEDTEVQREVLRTSIVVLDLASGAIEVVEHGGAADVTRDSEEEAA